MIFEPKPRWAQAPLFCIAANRMAFPDRSAMEAYRVSIGMSGWNPGRVWRCKVCGMGHYDALPLAPATPAAQGAARKRHLLLSLRGRQSLRRLLAPSRPQGRPSL
jgi:hypothetical protein